GELQLICDCGGILSVKSIEEYPEEIKDKINYNRVCDVECLSCGKVLYSQPYDFSKKINLVRKIDKRSEEHTSELQSRFDLVCRLLLEKKNYKMRKII